MIKKEIHSQDSHYKLNTVRSGESSINLSNELLAMIAPELQKGQDKVVEFIIHKQDYVDALAYLASKLPLYTSSSKEAYKVENSLEFFTSHIDEINSIFKEDDQAIYIANLKYREEGRIYLNDLSCQGFNLRHFLLEENSTLIFEKVDDAISLSLQMREYNNIARDKKVNNFAAEVIKALLEYDGMETLFPFFQTSDKNYIQLKQGNNTLYRLFNPDLNDPRRGVRWSDYTLQVKDKSYLFCLEWTEATNTNSVPSLFVLDEIIRNAYNGLFSIEKEDDYFVLKRNQIQNNLEIFHGQSPLQQIYYGAPGTGKSHDVKIQTGELDASGNKHEKLNVFRTTFHPDTDYATFVGCYKPTMKPVAEKYRAVAGKEEEIVYEFVPQAFTDAYIYAYNHIDEPTYLVIEEINRGNCAQIFGDLFQLLDRKADGTSEYTIKADKDLAKYLLEGKDKNGNDILTNKEGIKDGKLRLPANLNILATMNTSDQSLFPMDSAFKRRWDWEYMPIKYSNTDWKIDIDGSKYNWVDFQTEINKRVFDATDSEDKQLGDYFVKADANNIISAKLLLNKVIFYLWNDVCKDGDGDIFKINTDLDYTKELDPANNEDITFSQFFENTNLKLQQWMRYLDIKPN